MKKFKYELDKIELIKKYINEGKTVQEIGILIDPNIAYGTFKSRFKKLNLKTQLKPICRTWDTEDIEIVKKYHINYCYSAKQDYSDEYNLYFNVVGKLKEVFEEYDLAAKLECRFNNDKGKELIIVSKCSDINVETASTNLDLIYFEWELYKLEDFYNAISKLIFK